MCSAIDFRITLSYRARFVTHLLSVFFTLTLVTLFGFEVNIEALLSPTHLLLASSAILIMAGPFRAAWQRTDAVNAHNWRTLFPALLAGAGVRGGSVYGSSDKDAAYPVDHPTSPEDLAATVYHALGIDPETRVTDAQGRPVSLVEGGEPVTRLFG